MPLGAQIQDENNDIMGRCGKKPRDGLEEKSAIRTWL
jgi:hypothetical protein